jgi:hypothetical protein
VGGVSDDATEDDANTARQASACRALRFSALRDPPVFVVRHAALFDKAQFKCGTVPHPRQLNPSQTPQPAPWSSLEHRHSGRQLHLLRTCTPCTPQHQHAAYGSWGGCGVGGLTTAAKALGRKAVVRHLQNPPATTSADAHRTVAETTRPSARQTSSPRPSSSAATRAASWCIIATWLRRRS